MANCRGCGSYYGEQNRTHRAGALGPGLGALVGLVLGLDLAGFVVWPVVIGSSILEKDLMSRPQIGLIFWVFWELSCLLSMTWKFHFFPRISIPKSPESEFEAWAQSL